MLDKKEIELHEHYMAICDSMQRFCKCKSRQLGALVVAGEVVVPGYNGPARNVPHCGDEMRSYLVREMLATPTKKRTNGVTEDMLHPQNMKEKCPRHVIGAASGERLDLCIAAHAEINAILNCARQGVRTLGAVMYSNNTAPCKDCMKYIINAGIKRIIYNHDIPLYRDAVVSMWMAHHAKVELIGFSRKRRKVTAIGMLELDTSEQT